MFDFGILSKAYSFHFAQCTFVHSKLVFKQKSFRRVKNHLVKWDEIAKNIIIEANVNSDEMVYKT